MPRHLLDQVGDVAFAVVDQHGAVARPAHCQLADCLERFDMHAMVRHGVADRGAATGIGIDEDERVGVLHEAFSLLDFA